MTIDQAIKQCEDEASEFEFYLKKASDDQTADSCKQCAAEHRQLAEWLRELKALKEKRYGEWKDQMYDETLEYFTATCSCCGYISSDPFVIEGSHLTCERCGAKMMFKVKE